jgi:hypothetical protein
VGVLVLMRGNGCPSPEERPWLSQSKGDIMVVLVLRRGNGRPNPKERY